MISEKLIHSFAENPAVQCWLCRHASTVGSLPVCTAFPGLIPVAIQENRFDHRRPWIDPETGEPGDTGITGERSITFEPDPDVDAAVLERLYRHLDSLPR